MVWISSWNNVINIGASIIILYGSLYILFSNNLYKLKFIWLSESELLEFESPSFISGFKIFWRLLGIVSSIIILYLIANFFRKRLNSLKKLFICSCAS